MKNTNTIWTIRLFDHSFIQELRPSFRKLPVENEVISSAVIHRNGIIELVRQQVQKTGVTRIKYYSLFPGGGRGRQYNESVQRWGMNLDNEKRKVLRILHNW